MPIDSVIPDNSLENYIEERAKRMIQAIIFRLKVIGEKCVNAARISDLKGKDYTDQTGNLRSSTGYVIVKDGQIVTESSFEVVKNGRQGSMDGRALAERLANDYQTGIVLIVVAGMNYSIYVADRGFDVLDSAEDLARTEIPRMLEKLGLNNG